MSVNPTSVNPVHSQSSSQQEGHRPSLDLPESPVLYSSVVKDDMSFSEMCESFWLYFVENIDTPQTLATLKVSPARTALSKQLCDTSHNPATLAALLWCRAQFDSAVEDEEGGFEISKSRALACELVASDLVSSLSPPDALRYLCYELSLPKPAHHNHHTASDESNEGSHLLGGEREREPVPGGPLESAYDPEADLNHLTSHHEYAGLNILEIAVLAGAKKFISHRPVQKIVTGMWDGSISFWNDLDKDAVKKPHFYSKRNSDPFCRLRVPKYQKIFEAFFFLVLLGLFYAVLVERNPGHITGLEITLVIFFVAFTVDELSSVKDAGTTFYTQDFWSFWDLTIILIATAFLVFRIVGIVKDSNPDITETAFDVLSLEALALVPRAFSLLSLNPYFGVLIPCLKQMTKDFLKFLVLVIILYVGFLTTFALLARGKMSLSEISWILVYVFFGSSYYGFDAMRAYSPVIGPPLMFIFVILTNILLITSLISLLSNSLTKTMNNAREEYLFMFSVMVLEASTSNRLVVFYPPMNLLPLVLLRPLRLVLSARRIRGYRVSLLKLVHFPILAVILGLENMGGKQETRHTAAWGLGPQNTKNLGLGLQSFNRPRRGERQWSGRLGGTRFGLGGGGGAQAHAAATMSSSSSEREQIVETNERDQRELRQLRATVAELGRKIDEMLR